MFHFFIKHFGLKNNFILILFLGLSLQVFGQTERKFHFGVHLGFINEYKNIKDIFSFKKSDYQPTYGWGIEPGLAVNYKVSKRLYIFGTLGYSFARKYQIDSISNNISYRLMAKHRMIRMSILPYIPLFDFEFLSSDISFSAVGELSYNITKYRYYDNNALLFHNQNNFIGYGGGINISINGLMVFFRFVKIGEPVFISTNLFVLF